MGPSVRTAGGAGHIVSPRAQLVYFYTVFVNRIWPTACDRTFQWRQLHIQNRANLFTRNSYNSTFKAF